MPTVVKENIDDLNAILTVTITREDIAPKIKSELKRYRNQAQLKGFRKGKTPMGMLKKMFGQNIMADVVNKTLETEINEYLKDQKNLLGQPIPSTAQEDLDMSISGTEDLVFKFDLGFAPEFEVAGVDKDTKLSMYQVTVPEQMIEDDLMFGRKRVGKRVNVDELIQEGDLVTINANELDGDAIKLDGWPATFSVLYNDIQDEAVTKDLATKKVGDSFRFNIRTLEGERTDEFIRKQLLGVGEGDEDVVIGDHFEGTIEAVSRIEPAELDQEFFDKYFGEGKITSEEEARSFIQEDIQKHYARQAGALVRRDLQELLLEKNQQELPNEFLKRYLVATSENNTMENVDKGYSSFARGLQWTLVRERLAERFDVKVAHEDVIERTKQTIAQYYGQHLDPSMMDAMAERFLQDQNQYRRTFDELIDEKVFDAAVDAITITETPIGKEEFEEVMKEAQAAAQAENAQVDVLTEEE